MLTFGFGVVVLGIGILISFSSISFIVLGNENYILAYAFVVLGLIVSVVGAGILIYYL